MIKKTLVAVGAVTLLSVVLFGRDAASYIRTSAGWVKDSVKSSVPLEFEIERARQMVHNLIPDIRRNMHVIATEEERVAVLDKQIAENSGCIEKSRVEILKLKTDLATPQNVYLYAGRSYSADQVKVDLANRFERFKTQEATLANLRDLQTARRRSLDAARQKLEGMLVAKRQLEVDVENLEARFKMVEVAQTTADVNVDDSQLGRVKELITDVRTRLNVAERLVHAQDQMHDEIQLTTPKSDNIVDQVTEYFNAEKDSAKVAEAKTGTSN